MKLSVNKLYLTRDNRVVMINGYDESLRHPYSGMLSGRREYWKEEGLWGDRIMDDRDIVMAYVSEKCSTLPPIEQALQSLTSIDIPWEVKRVTGMNPEILVDSNGGLQIYLGGDNDTVDVVEFRSALKWWLDTLDGI